MKKTLSLLLCLAMLVSLFAGCGDKPEPAKSEALTINGAEIADYTFVFADETSMEFKMELANFRKTLGDTMGGALNTAVDKPEDAANIPATAKEIVIGTTRRPSDKLFGNLLRENDFVIAAHDGRLYIRGGNEASTLKAVTYFEENYFNKTDKKIEIPAGDPLVVTDQTDSFPLFTVQLDGVNLRDYNIVIPVNATLSERMAAQHFSDFFLTNAGYALTVVTDANPEIEREILIGNTNRAASQTGLKPDMQKMEYVLFQQGTKVVVQGESYMVGGGLGELTRQIPLDGTDAAYALPALSKKAEIATFVFDDAQNAILLIGDGMGFNQIEMALPDMDGKYVGADLPHRGEAKTDNVDLSTTDSAAGGTALSTGYKTKNGRIGQDKNTENLLNIRELAHSIGAKTAVITTDNIHGATPAAFLAHVNYRDQYDTIDAQIAALKENGEVTVAKGDVGDQLTTEVAKALTAISKGGSRYFMMVEEAAIDWAGHSNNAKDSNRRVVRMNEMAAYVIQFVLCHPDTVMVISADHETGGLKKQDDGSFQYTSGDHSSVNVPIYAIGKGTEVFNGQAVENVEIPKFMAKVFGEQNFGQ